MNIETYYFGKSTVVSFMKKINQFFDLLGWIK